MKKVVLNISAFWTGENRAKHEGLGKLMLNIAGQIDSRRIKLQWG